MTDLTIDLEQIEHLSQKHHDDFEVLRYMLELNDDVSDTQIDTWVDKIAQPIIEAIDCKQCANCCHSLDVYLTEEDARRLADGIDVPLDSIMIDIERDAAQKVQEWGKFTRKPCRFLNGKLCSIYEHRPETCRTYPVFTPDFRWTLRETIDGASICPIIYNVLVTLHQRIHQLYNL